MQRILTCFTQNNPGAGRRANALSLMAMVTVMELELQAIGQAAKLVKAGRMETATVNLKGMVRPELVVFLVRDAGAASPAYRPPKDARHFRPEYQDLLLKAVVGPGDSYRIVIDDRSPLQSLFGARPLGKKEQGDGSNTFVSDALPASSVGLTAKEASRRDPVVLSEEFGALLADDVQGRGIGARMGRLYYHISKLIPPDVQAVVHETVLGRPPMSGNLDGILRDGGPGR